MSGTRHCEGCTCTDSVGRIDTAAPFYRLVIELDRIIWAEHRAARTKTATP